MKKLLLILAAIAAIAALGGFAYVLMFMEEDPDTLLVGGSSDPGSLPDAQLNLPREVETQADVLDALDYETKQNQDTVGWITIPGTRVNNSVLQAHDNIAYLRTNERKEASVYGCYFADAECNIGGREVLSPNVVIYGHSDLQDNPDGQRFSQLFKYTDYEFARTHPVLTFSTPQETMTWQVFAVYYTDLDLDFTRTEMDGTALVELANSAKARSIYDYGVTVDENDKIISLVTCTLKYGKDSRSQVRYVVAAKLLDEGETPVNITQLKQNENPLQPSIK